MNETDSTACGCVAAKDRARLDWLAAHPVNTKWNHQQGWIISYGYPWGEASGTTFIEALDAAMADCARKSKEIRP